MHPKVVKTFKLASKLILTLAMACLLTSCMSFSDDQKAFMWKTAKALYSKAPALADWYVGYAYRQGKIDKETYERYETEKKAWKEAISDEKETQPQTD